MLTSSIIKLASHLGEKLQVVHNQLQHANALRKRSSKDFLSNILKALLQPNTGQT